MSAIHGPRVSPSLDLNFARNKSLVDTMTGRNLIDFSRVQSGSSKSSYFGADGVLKYADSNEPRFDHDPVTGESLGLLVEESRTNLLTYSEYLDTWNKDNVTVIQNQALAPNGALTMDKIVDDSTNGLHQIRKPFTPPSSSFTISIYVKYNDIAWVYLKYFGYGCAFNIQTGQVGTPTANATSPQIIPLGNGVYRISVNITNSVGADAIIFGLSTSDSTVPSYAGTGSSVFAWGFQSENGSFPTSYIPTPATFVSRADSTQGASYYDANGIIQYTALGAARDNAYFPDENGVMKPAGLLLEAAGTNLIRYSQDISKNTGVGGPWVYNLTASTTPGVFQTYIDFSTTIISPDGISTAPFVTIGDRGQLTQIINLASQQTITLSFWARRDPSYSGRDCNAYIAQSGNDGLYNFAPLVRSDRWTRISYTRTMPAGSTIVGIYRLGNSGIYDGLYVWGFQLEASPYPTSYIPTTSSAVTRAADVSSSSTVTRSADVAQITGANFSSWYNQSEGTVFADAICKGLASSSVSFVGHLGDGSTDNYIDVLRYQPNSVSLIVTGGVVQSQLGTTLPVGVYRKSAHAYAPNNVSLAVDGATPLTDSSATLPTVNQIKLGGDSTSIRNLNGTISRLTYYPERLSNTFLQKLTR